MGSTAGADLRLAQVINEHLENEKKLMALLAPQKVLCKACSKVSSEDPVRKGTEIQYLSSKEQHCLYPLSNSSTSATKPKLTKIVICRQHVASLGI